MTRDLASFTCAPSYWELIDIKFVLQESFCNPAKLENLGENRKFPNSTPSIHILSDIFLLNSPKKKVFWIIWRTMV